MFSLAFCSQILSLRFTAIGLLDVSSWVSFDPEDGGDILFQNVGWLSADYAALHPRR
jgi:hypothetical protein